MSTRASRSAPTRCTRLHPALPRSLRRPPDWVNSCRVRHSRSWMPGVVRPAHHALGATGPTSPASPGARTFRRRFIAGPAAPQMHPSNASSQSACMGQALWARAFSLAAQANYADAWPSLASDPRFGKPGWATRRPAPDRPGPRGCPCDPICVKRSMVATRTRTGRSSSS